MLEAAVTVQTALRLQDSLANSVSVAFLLNKRPLASFTALSHAQCALGYQCGSAWRCNQSWDSHVKTRLVRLHL